MCWVVELLLHYVQRCHVALGIEPFNQGKKTSLLECVCAQLCFQAPSAVALTHVASCSDGCMFVTVE